MLPDLITPVPGPRSQQLAARLGEVECRNTTFRSPEWPVFWERAEGVNVWDADGNRYLELTSAFGVATLGHGFTAEAVRHQSRDLLHAMGDVHPARLKVELCERLSAITFESWTGGKGKTLLGNSGFEAVEAALKTAALATRRTGILAFEGAYHGLGYGALLGAGIPWFREPFDNQLARITTLLPFPADETGLDAFRSALANVDGHDIGAVLVEPIQGRGGIIIPPPSFLRELREWCDQTGALLIFDEIFTGLNRTGKRFACEWDGVVPDLVCLGKALSGGFPISACVGKAAVMDAWPETHGEALHTSTFLGNPLGCAMAIAALDEHLKPATTAAAADQGTALHTALMTLSGEPFVTAVRGRGLLQAIELHHPDGRPAGDVAIGIVQELLQQGVLLLPEGPTGHVLAFSPPLGLDAGEIGFAVEWLRQSLRRKNK
ncbi:aspartate aminotransferase family protein [Luteolibacter ambystomatis]|uniref:Aspartate aminotransferase family protein n=1 Tax=Luteolibacter ambystomatis TaxID=2824561 RepID=A0A975IZT2_9BACT|nr:aspartate aminotransferase family protein [Luteolibacter ambystomatis]QUE50160.1 aspartate aminotransferase family protein [Luteolibacter ambystomatis]